MHQRSSTPQPQPRRSRGRQLRIAGVVVGVAAAIYVVVVVLPAWLAPRDAFPTAGAAILAQNDIRTTLVQELGGAVVLLGALAAWRQLQTGRQQLALAEQGQITERFTRAVDQLGSEHLDVRLGGIYALERIALDSPPDSARFCVPMCASASHGLRPARTSQPRIIRSRSWIHCGSVPPTCRRR